MEKTKEQMIADLYALRGGLSVISQYSNEIKSLEDKNKQSHQLCVQIKDECAATQSAIARLEQNLATEFSDNDSTIEELSKSIEANKKTIDYLERTHATMDTELTREEKRSCTRGRCYTQKFVWTSLLLFVAIAFMVGFAIMCFRPNSETALLFIWIPGVALWGSFKLWWG